MKGRSGHRVFAAFWDFSVRHEPRHIRETRGQAAKSVRGRVLEIGVGNGANWEWLPEDADYTGIDPDPYMLERAKRRAAERGRSYDLRLASAEALPFDDASFDTVLVTLALCTVSDPRASLKEMRRVLRPDGQLIFWEHVRPAGRVMGRLSDAIEPIWGKVGGGCHPNRRTEDSIRSAGFQITELWHGRLNGIPTIAGTANPA